MQNRDYYPWVPEDCKGQYPWQKKFGKHIAKNCTPNEQILNAGDGLRGLSQLGVESAAHRATIRQLCYRLNALVSEYERINGITETTLPEQGDWKPEWQGKTDENT